MAPSVVTANSFAELEQVPGLAPTLALPLAEVASRLVLPVGVQARLREVAAEGLTLRDFLRRKDLHQELGASVRYPVLLQAFKAWLSRQPLAAPGSATLPGLLAASGIPDLAAWSADMFLGDFRGADTDLRLGELAAKPQHATRAAALAIEQGLADFVAAVQRRRAALRNLPSLPERFAGVRSGHAGLDALLVGLAAERQRLLEGWPTGLVEATVNYRPVGEALVLRVDFTGDAVAPLPEWGRSGRGPDWDRFDDLDQAPDPDVQVTLPDVPRWLGAPELGCTCGRAPCVHRALALDALLDGAQRAQSQMGSTLVRLLAPGWQRVLDEFARVPSPRKADKPASISVLLSERTCQVLVHEVGKRGKSKQGRALSSSRAALERLEGLDRRIAELWSLAGGAWSGAQSPLLGDALLLCEGHPDVRTTPGGAPVPVRVGAAHVALREVEGGVEVEVLAGDAPVEELRGYASSRGLVLVRPGPTEVRLWTVAPEVQQLVQALVRHGEPRFPKEALPALVQALPRLEAAARVELPDELKGEEVPAVSRPVVRVASDAARVTVAVRTEPLPGGPLFVPGQGVAASAAFDGARRRFATRDFEAELAAAAALSGELGLDPSLAGEPFSWALEAGDKSIETLRRVAHLLERGIPVEWTGPRPRFTRPVDLRSLKLRVEKRRDWFGLDGAAEVDDRRVALAAVLEAARLRRRWVALGKDDYAELSEELVQRLAPLAHLAGDAPTPTLTLGTVPLVEALAGEVAELDAVEGWKRLTERLAQAKERSYPVPKALAPVLRDYQAQGFTWLSRLADWGAGACLADDMGLGKTLQALALLVARQKLGPALVVAPSSVLHVWKQEAARFAPRLQVRFFHEEDRALVAGKPGEVVVVSWTLLAREAEAFAAQQWATVVLDEAQAIKNSGTLRAKAAHRLQSDFTVALSGTPIENHVGELWSLFRAVLPALLGSEESFRRRFAGGAPDAVKALSALVQPFILRRTKGAVAKELPPRTDLEVLVSLSKEERALYDDVRLSAVAELGEVTGESKRFDVLAALTRLRLTACHPRLVDKEWKGAASKLARLLELVRDLSASGHRVLVFSQFTQHLGLVAEALHAEGVAHSALDGQTPLAERQRRVEAFQAGKGGDVFLISLKAGGTGLTLTAADYVIHLDPWWNPAVEDQASDRAHRIGQDRPVTVYRLIAEGTIEQEILAMHRDKRELVDALLSGADQAGKLSAAELVKLIRGG